MTTTPREKLIDRGVAAIRAETTREHLTARAAVGVLYDAGWRPPVEGDVIERAKAAALDGVHREDCFDPNHEDCMLFAGQIVDALADAGLLHSKAETREGIFKAGDRVRVKSGMSSFVGSTGTVQSRKPVITGRSYWIMLDREKDEFGFRESDLEPLADEPCGCYTRVVRTPCRDHQVGAD